MPDTLFALAVLVILVFPGVIFAVQLDNQRPIRELSPLRELAAISGVGVICNAVVLLIFGVARAIFPKITPDVGSIERNGASYVKPHFVSIGWWAICLLLASCGLAYALGYLMPQIAGRVASGKITFTSAWWEVFHQHPDAYMYVGCQLQDDSYIAGFLMRYSTEVDETPDRELVLCAPISYRPSGGKESPLDNVGTVTISASQLRFLTVTYTNSYPETVIPVDTNH
jgi:hypothetical protein